MVVRMVLGEKYLSRSCRSAYGGLGLGSTTPSYITLGQCDDYSVGLLSARQTAVHCLPGKQRRHLLEDPQGTLGSR